MKGITKLVGIMEINLATAHVDNGRKNVNTKGANDRRKYSCYTHPI
jgi:hypothetical protein